MTSGPWSTAIDAAIRREPIVPGDSARSGSAVERVTLADGRVVIAKVLDPAHDLVLRATGDDGRLQRMWDRSLFDDMPPVIRHAILGVEPMDAGWLVVMEDVGPRLLPDDRMITRSEGRAILAAGAAMHAAFEATTAPLGHIALLYRFLSPAMAVAEREADNPLPAMVGRGWERFGDVVPPDVADAIAAIHLDPERFAARFAGLGSTLVHGDFRFANIGLEPGRLVLIDWGSSCVVGPGALDVAWYLIVGATRIEASREDVLEDFRVAEGDRFEARALGLALIGALAQLGWNKALDVTEGRDPAVRARERADLDWWVARVRGELETEERGS
jgi:hypothetical protein